ncbi:unnamed protein product [Porites lobata]|uniref:Uncharacterized protein n=1 Tax=Porites lobata TaxID=104759 RepID=A0ABN8RPW7_9CNID|nr:unnamed protein product [Porites lobata]
MLRLGNDGFNVEVKLDELEQYARRDCLEITVIPVVPNDSPALLVKEMSEIMGVNFNENDISIAHRLPPTKKVKDRLIVKFTRREKRDEIYSKRKNFKSKGRTIRKLMGSGAGENLPSVVCEPESVVPTRNNSNKKYFRDYSKFNKDLYLDDIKLIDWHEILNPEKNL